MSPRKILRAAFLLGAGCVWLMVLGLVLEIVGAVQEAQAVRDYNSAVREMKVAPCGMKQVPVEIRAFDRTLAWTPISGKARFSGEIDSLLKDIALDLCAPDKDGPSDISDDIRAARVRFASASHSNLNAVATLQGDWVAVLDGQGTCLHSWGDPLIEELYFRQSSGHTPPFSELFERVRDLAAKSGDQGPIMFAYGWFGCNMPMAIRKVDRHAGDAGNVVEVLVRDTTRGKDLNRFLLSPSPPESLWEIPCWGYRKHWRDKPDGPLVTNNFGFFERDVATPRPAGLLRIVCVGGSTTQEGASVDGSGSYTRLLEQELQRDAGTTAIEVLNCGIVASNSDSEMRRINEFLKQDPNLLIYYNGVNDIAFIAFPALYAYRSEVAKLMGRSRYVRCFLNRWLIANDETIKSFLRARTIRNLDALVFAARERHVDVVLCSFAYPDPALLDRRFLAFLDMNVQTSWCGGDIGFRTYCHVVDLLNGLIADLCKERGLVYVPVAENLHGGADYFLDACHTQLEGRERKARIIADTIGRYVKDAIRTGTFAGLRVAAYN